VDLSLTPDQVELQARAHAYVTDHLQPLEAEFERAGGRLAADVRDRLKRAAIDARLHGGSLPREAGGQGWSALDQVLVHEQLGQATPILGRCDLERAMWGALGCPLRAFTWMRRANDGPLISDGHEFLVLVVEEIRPKPSRLQIKRRCGPRRIAGHAVAVIGQ